MSGRSDIWRSRRTGTRDALAVTLSQDGQELIGHPGAASYYGHPEWRAAHRATRAHPTVTVDDQSQSVPGGPFMWTRHAGVHLRAVDLERGIVDAEHDGYQRLPEPVTHRRWVSAPPGQPDVLVVDEITGAGEHEVRTSWPLHPDLDVQEISQGHLVSRNGQALLQIMSSGLPEGIPDRIIADPETHLGWWSERLEQRVPSWQVGSVARGPVPLLMATVLHHWTEGEDPVCDLAVSRDGQAITVSWRSGGVLRRTVIDRSVAGAISSGASLPQP